MVIEPLPRGQNSLKSDCGAVNKENFLACLHTSLILISL
jgi:hypothetical protein